MMKLLKNSQGFSLMELMIAMAIFSVIIAVMITSRTDQQDQHITQIQAAEMQQNVRAVMFMMKRDIRMAGFNPFSKDDYDTGIIVAQSNTFAFGYVDISDPDNPFADTHTYTLEDDDGDGDMDITLEAVVLAENIQALTFNYFDGTAPIPIELPAPVATPANIRSIQISITASLDNDERARISGDNRQLSTLVLLRNMGL